MQKQDALANELTTSSSCGKEKDYQEAENAKTVDA
jgi:hypothetical protein